ncbi:T9SS type A sorting domain-containing protein [Flavobacterium covae]|uniref:M1 family aminopeptidase n=1 Tax=Flavobacterium covae TaxID=2906076 RepID=UPI001FB7A794|nr:M1 family aminopeptidase [Flavobacterium covae]MCJ1807719.1 T9SS type A sorting domain-containing protein [Flavobacterium covae]
MKKITFLFLLLSSFSFSQNYEKHKTEEIALSEMKAATKKMNLKINPNTQNYDLIYGKLEFNVDPNIYNINGKVTLTFKALEDIKTVTFELSKPLIVSSVKKGNTDLQFIHNINGELIITLPSIITIGNEETIEINYAGLPSFQNNAFTASKHNGAPIIYTLSEPYGSADWWPCKQDLNDKLEHIDVYITAPSQYTSVSNGIQVSRIINGPNATTHFRHNYPIAAYLVAFAVTNYSIKNTGTAGGNNTPPTPTFPIIDYIYPEFDNINTSHSLANTIPIINFLETKLGSYPFHNEKYGHAQFNWSGGMEHTTISFMGSFNRNLITHEMAHQWFGNKVTCGSWKDIWLNEGLTEYISGCVVENLDGITDFNAWKSSKITSITSNTKDNLYLYDYQLSDVNRIFSNQITYNKGSMVSHMLRYIMGDTNFFQALRNYLNDPILAYKCALTPQFQAHLEAVHGSSLQEFFNDWVYKEGYPIYNIKVHNSETNQATIRINQIQSITDNSQIGYVSYFEMPVPIRLILNNGTHLDLKLNNTFNNQLYTIDLPIGTSVSKILFDPNNDIISKGSTTSLSDENFELSTSINLFPNPSYDQIQIELPNTIQLQKIKILNHLGQEVLKTNEKKINIYHLNNGLYQVLIETTQGRALKKLLKK